METQYKDFTAVEEGVKAARKASRRLATLSTQEKDKLLAFLADELEAAAPEIIVENQKDLEAGQAAGLGAALLDRLRLDEKRIKAIADAVRFIIGLSDPVGRVEVGRTLPNGLQLNKLRVPLGVVGVIYESRPNVTIDIGALCLKSSNAAVLRGGKEAIHSNRVLAGVFRSALEKQGLPADALVLIDNPDRALVEPLLKLDQYIDIIVPRGGEKLIRFVAEKSTIPVVKHDKGVCAVFIDKTADPEMARDIIINAKTQRPSVCNAAEILVLEKGYPAAEDLLKSLKEAGVSLLADEATRSVFSGLEPLTETGYDTEYLDLRLSVKIVDTFAEGLEFIAEYSSGHSEALVTTDYGRSQEFTATLDSSALFVNCSTRFNDGGQFGMGAEVGISTGKLHARGPMGLDDLTTSKYVVRGTGQIRT